MILSANTVGEVGQELLYLRTDSLRPVLWIGLGALVLEVVEFAYAAFERQGILTAIPYEDAATFVNALQSVAFAVAAFLAYSVLRHYTPRGIERRIEENMEVIAQMSGRGRRRRTGERTERPERERGRTTGERARASERRTGVRGRSERERVEGD